MAMVPGRGGALARFLSTGQRCDLRSQFLVSKKNGFLPRRVRKCGLRATMAIRILSPSCLQSMRGWRGCYARCRTQSPTALQDCWHTATWGASARRSPSTAKLNGSATRGSSQVSPVAEAHQAALFRDYTFWASAYLLEPCHLSMLRTGEYGLGRAQLPRNIAVPLAIISKKLGTKPFMEYALSYAYAYSGISDNGALVCTIGKRSTPQRHSSTKI